MPCPNQSACFPSQIDISQSVYSEHYILIIQHCIRSCGKTSIGQSTPGLPEKENSLSNVEEYVDEFFLLTFHAPMVQALPWNLILNLNLNKHCLNSQKTGELKIGCISSSNYVRYSSILMAPVGHADAVTFMNGRHICCVCYRNSILESSMFPFNNVTSALR